MFSLSPTSSASPWSKMEYPMGQTRIERRFTNLKAAGEKALVTYIMAGDPDYDTSLEILKGLPSAGADLIELGLPFTDPMADGPTIQLAASRALNAGIDTKRVLDMVGAFRQGNSDTPIILMGYYNPIYQYGVGAFLRDAVEAGVDGLIVVDLPPEEDEELCLPAIKAGLNFIRLATPTTDDARLPMVLENTSGFIYYVSITGITGTALAQQANIKGALARLRCHTDLPIAVGFGIKTAEQVAQIYQHADAAVVGSAIVQALADTLDVDDCPSANSAERTLEFVRKLV